MLDKLKAAWAVFQKGKAVANPQAWKTAATAANAMAALLVVSIGALRVWGYDLPVADDDLQQLAGGVAALWFGAFGVYRTITNKDRGLPPKRLPDRQP
jgi:hypothetical protein